MHARQPPSLPARSPAGWLSRSKLEVAGSAVIRADVVAHSIAMAKGAVIDGTVTITSGAAPGREFQEKRTAASGRLKPPGRRLSRRRVASSPGLRAQQREHPLVPARSDPRDARKSRSARRSACRDRRVPADVRAGEPCRRDDRVIERGEDVRRHLQLCQARAGDRITVQVVLEGGVARCASAPAPRSCAAGRACARALRNRSCPATAPASCAGCAATCARSTARTPGMPACSAARVATGSSTGETAMTRARRSCAVRAWAATRSMKLPPSEKPTSCSGRCGKRCCSAARHRPPPAGGRSGTDRG